MTNSRDAATGEAPALLAESLTKRYGRTVALRDVSLRLPEGSLTALVGPNAAGKSTLIKTFVGFERPTAGRVAVAGIDPTRDPAGALLHVGYIPQTPALYRDLTVADHLDLAARLRPGFDRDIAVGRLATLRIPARARAGSLSGGQAAQLSLAVALGTGADIYLLDEPLASLDPLARREFLATLDDVARTRAATVLLSSHIVGELGSVCDRIVVLGVGRVLFEGRIVDAVATHRATDALAGDGVIAAFPAADGRMLGLKCGGSDGRPATLEEIALGYLAAGRPPDATELGWRDAS